MLDKNKLKMELTEKKDFRNSKLYDLAQCGVLQGRKKKSLQKEIEILNKEISDLEVTINGLDHYK